MKIKYFLLFFFLFQIQLSVSQSISVDLSVKWEKETDIFDSDSIVYTPKLLVTYRNNSDDSLYFLKVSHSRNELPILPWGSLLQVPVKDCFDCPKRAKTHLNYTDKEYYVIFDETPLYSKGWEVLSDTTSYYNERETENINDDLANIYEYIYRRYFYSDSALDNKIYFSQTDIFENQINPEVNDRFVFLKPQEEYTDSYNLIAFQMVKGNFSFIFKDHSFKNYVLLKPLWNENQKRYFENKKYLPDEIKGYKLYYGNFSSNEAHIKF